ncbi:hypothetical protein HHK36_014584 [Tetracentron sinense]|uniref:Uncharacterized protein n=1 Tax=Tetracentron sinense TaxID=13715 RepID=A0A834Z4P0_TETSI|nr:hypothetical protein HHK36_014584 [Tetracentron sinense]
MGISNRDEMVEKGEIALEEMNKSSKKLIEDQEEEEKREVDESVERIFEKVEVPSWQRQLTVRAFLVSLLLGIMFSFIVMKLNLTTGIIPSLNVAAGLLGYFFVKTWTTFLDKSGMLKQPFTRQENTVIQTCVVATSGIAFSGFSFSFSFSYPKYICLFSW